jgi:hypothetical protein
MFGQWAYGIPHGNFCQLGPQRDINRGRTFHHNEKKGCFINSLATHCIYML